MAIAHKILTEITTVAASAAAVFTNPASTDTHITAVILHNTNTTSEDVKVWNVPDSGGAAGTAADANRFDYVTLEANETLELELPKAGIRMEDTNDTLQMETDTASKVTVQVFGTQEAQ